jgi:hypothetical protein
MISIVIESPSAKQFLANALATSEEERRGRRNITSAPVLDLAPLRL